MDVGSMDPLEAIGPLCTGIVLRCLGPKDLVCAGLVCSAWAEATLGEPQCRDLWAPHLAQLWAGKVYVPDVLRELGRERPRSAYAASLEDAKRDTINEEELCRFTWQLGFKSIAWFSAALGASSRFRRYYHPNHTITAPRDDPLWGDVEPQRHYWYTRQGPNGKTVIQVNTYPFLTVRRTPDWGFTMENAAVRLTVDAEAGPNPGLPPDHPAAKETLTVAQIEARFNDLLALHGAGYEDTDTEDEEEEEEEEDGDDEGMPMVVEGEDSEQEAEVQVKG